MCAGIDLYWIPLGAGGHFVRLNGKVYEAVQALVQRRARRNLYHSALVVSVSEGSYVIECAWVSSTDSDKRGVVAAGPVWNNWAGRLRPLSVTRCAVGWAAPSPMSRRRWRARNDSLATRATARRLIELSPQVPTPAMGPGSMREWERCGTPTRSSHGLLGAAVLTQRPCVYRKMDGRPVGMPVLVVAQAGGVRKEVPKIDPATAVLVEVADATAQLQCTMSAYMEGPMYMRDPAHGGDRSHQGLTQATVSSSPEVTSSAQGAECASSFPTSRSSGTRYD